MNKKRIYITIVIFSLLIATGLFYLAVALDAPIFVIKDMPGLLSPDKDKKPNPNKKKNTNPGYNSNVRLIIIDAYLIDKGPNDTVGISITGDKLFFDVEFDDVGTKVIKFKIKNIGNKKTILNYLKAPKIVPSSGIVVTWPDLNDLVLSPGQQSIEYSIVINAVGIGSKTASDLNAVLDYSEYVK